MASRLLWARRAAPDLACLSINELAEILEQPQLSSRPVLMHGGADGNHAKRQRVHVRGFRDGDWAVGHGQYLVIKESAVNVPKWRGCYFRKRPWAVSGCGPKSALRQAKETILRRR
jgi:hypothetical protein